MSEVHVMYQGKQEDISFEDLFPAERYEAIGIAPGTEVIPSNVTDNQIRAALAQYYDVGLNEFSDQYIEKNPNGNITIRANTPFG